MIKALAIKMIIEDWTRMYMKKISFVKFISVNK